MADDSGTARRDRPSMGDMRTSSFLRQHQQYRPPHLPESHFNIDAVVEDMPARTARTRPNSPPSPSLSRFNGISSSDHRVVDSGVAHELSHPNCTPAPGAKRPERIVATLFYKHNSPRVSNAIPSPRRLPSPGTECEMPANMAPSSSLETFPLEPPAAEPEPLDHIYGSHVSPMCITSFLHLMSSFPAPAGCDEPASSHRCLGLDAANHAQVVEVTLAPAPSHDYLSLADLRKHEQIYRFEREWNVDVALQRDDLWRRYPRLVVFDMDSTLIAEEVIDLLAATVTDRPDLAARVAEITRRAMLGELEFDSAFRERVALLRGVPASVLTDLQPALHVTPGVRPLLRALKRLGVRTAVLSGGFQPLTSWLAGELGLDHAHANRVTVDGATGLLTGEVEGRIVGPETKRDLLLDIAAKEGIASAQVVAVGDGANDLLMLGAAGLGVAWNAKPRVQMEADARLNGDSLLDLLYLFGFNSDEISALTA